MKKAPKKEPMEWDVSVYCHEIFDVPFTAPQDSVCLASNQFEDLRSHFNKMSQNQKITYVEPREIINFLYSSIDHFKLKSDEFSKLQLIRLHLCGHLLSINLFNKSDPDHLLTAKNLLDEIQMTDELWWYKVWIDHYLYECGHLSFKDRNTIMLNALEQMKSKRYHNSIYSHIIKFNRSDDADHPDWTTYELCSSRVVKGPIELNGECAQARHDFVMRRLSNPEYFEQDRWRKLLSMSTPSIKGVVKREAAQLFVLEKSISQSVSITPAKLCVFACHIVPPSSPMLKITIPWKTDEEQKKFNFELKKRLRTAGFCTSEGHLRLTHLKDGVWIPKILINEAELDRFKQHAITIYESIFGKFPNRQLYNEFYSQLDKIKNSLQQFYLLEELRSQVSGFDSREALAMLYQCLVTHPYGLSPDKVISVKNLVWQSLEVSAEIHNLYLLSNRKADSKFFNNVTNLVKSVISKIISTKPQAVLFHVGTPIHQARTGKDYSTHAFYVFFKKTGKASYRIVIMNGGYGLQFHKPDLSIDERDFISTNCPQHHYVASGSFRILRHIYKIEDYLVRILTSEYTRCNNQTEEDDILKDIYFSHQEKDGKTYSRSVSGKDHHHFVHETVENTFLIQPNGCCTVFNLVNAIKFAYDMDELEYGLFTDNILIGFDRIVSKFKYKTSVLTTDEIWSRLQSNFREINALLVTYPFQIQADKINIVKKRNILLKGTKDLLLMMPKERGLSHFQRETLTLDDNGQSVIPPPIQKKFSLIQCVEDITNEQFSKIMFALLENISQDESPLRSTIVFSLRKLINTTPELLLSPKYKDKAIEDMFIELGQLTDLCHQNQNSVNSQIQLLDFCHDPETLNAYISYILNFGYVDTHIVEACFQMQNIPFIRLLDVGHPTHLIVLSESNSNDENSVAICETLNSNSQQTLTAITPFKTLKPHNLLEDKPTEDMLPSFSPMNN